MADDESFEKQLAFLERLPAIDLTAGRKSIGRDRWTIRSNGGWMIDHQLKSPQSEQ